ncbi:MAG TPA: PAS domain S-box protein [Lacunisphaera sp.]|nr:PAS domain S-box protein [Lacunisphaera sp.]
MKASIKEVDDLKAALDEHAIVAVTDPQGRITFVNDKFCAISKYARAELLGQDHRLINSGHHPPEFIRELWTTIAHGRVWRGEIKNRAKDGSFYWVDTTIVPFLDPNGKPRQYVAIRTDITARKQAEEKLNASNKEVLDLKTALDEHAIVAITDAHGKITFVNDKFCAISKYAREELLGQDHRLINSGFHPKEFIRELWTTIREGRVWRGEIKNRAKDGSLYWVDTTIVPFLDANGKPRQYVAIRTDITARKEAEEKLNASTKEVMDLKAALDEHAIVAITDAHGKITFVNDKFCAISKYAREELLGQDHRIINSGHHPKEFIRELWATIRQGRVWHGQLRNRAKDGSFYWVDTTIVPFLGENGKPRQYVAIRADITERKRIEMEIKELNAELEHRVVERTAQLEAANEQLESFSYSVSHDLRAPLRAVDGFSQAVLEDFGPQLPDEGRRQLQTIRSAAQQMGVLIDDLLTFSRLSRQSLAARRVDFNAMVRGVLQELGAPWADRRVEVRCADLPPALGDPALLKQVWLNLLSNALKYSGKRSPAVIEIGVADKAGRPAYFVRDNGTGFDMRYAGKLFGVFQRLHRPEEFEGTGVGLAIVQRIVQRHGGQVWADAAVDRGATFHFTLKSEPPT